MDTTRLTELRNIASHFRSAIEAQDATSALAALSADESQRLARFLATIEARSLE